MAWRSRLSTAPKITHSYLTSLVSHISGSAYQTQFKKASGSGQMDRPFPTRAGRQINQNLTPKQESSTTDLKKKPGQTPETHALMKVWTLLLYIPKKS